MVQFALFLVRLFKAPIQWLGVDFPQFEILIGTKLTIDFRSSPTGFQISGSKKSTFLYQLLTFSLFGLLFGIAAFSIGDLILSLTIFFTVIMVSLTMTIISEFTSVLFDQRDNYILLPRPISSRTLLLLRLVHIQFYIGFIALALSLATGIIVAVKYKGIIILIYFIAVGLSTWMTLIFTTFIYLMISKVVNGERFKDLITYAQIAIAVIIFGSYQIVPRLIDTAVLKNVTMSVHWWTYYFPPAWLAALVKLSLFTPVTTPFLLLSFLAVFVPITGAVFLIRSMSKGFGNILADGSSETVTPQNGRTLNTRLTSRINKYLFIVICGFSGSTAILQLPYTDTPEAAWIYKALPLKENGHLLTGAVKAILFRFIIPIYLLITIPSILLWGFTVFPQIILSCLGNILLVLIAIIFQKMELPFTQVREMHQKGTNSLRAILNMILMSFLVGFVYITSSLSGWITILICGLVAGLIVLIFRFIRKSWISPKGWVTLRNIEERL